MLVGSVNSLSPTPAFAPHRTGLPSSISTIISYRRPTAARSVSQPSAANQNNLIHITPQPLLPTTSVCKPVHFGLLNIRSLNNKSFLCHDFITFNNLDFFIITETWLSQGDSSPLIEANPPNFLHLNQPRMSGRGGGLLSFTEMILNVPVLHIIVKHRLNILLLFYTPKSQY